MEHSHDVAKHESHEHKNHQHTHPANPKNDTPEDEGKKHRKSLLFMFIGLGIVILVFVGIMLLSRYMSGRNDSVVEYNNYVFQKFEGNKWMTQQLIGGQLYNIPFYNNPEQVLDIPVDPNAVRNLRIFRAYSNGTVYITVDPNESSKVVLAGVEYARILGTAYGIYNMNVKSAISESVNNTSEEGFSIVTCRNQSKDTFVIYQKVTDKNLISVDGACILLESKDANESIRVADAFAFRLLNIIRDEESGNVVQNPK